MKCSQNARNAGTPLPSLCLWIESEGLGENRTFYVEKDWRGCLCSWILMLLNNIPGCSLDSVLKSITWNDKFHAGK